MDCISDGLKSALLFDVALDTQNFASLVRYFSQAMAFVPSNSSSNVAALKLPHLSMIRSAVLIKIFALAVLPLDYLVSKIKYFFFQYRLQSKMTWSYKFYSTHFLPFLWVVYLFYRCLVSGPLYCARPPTVLITLYPSSLMMSAAFMLLTP